MGVVTATFTVMSDDAVPVPVDDVLIRVYDSLGVYVTEGTTGAVTPGELSLSLTGDVGGLDYTAWPSKDGWSFVPTTFYDVTIFDPPGFPPDDNNFQLTAHEGMEGMLVTFVVKDDQGTPQPVEGVQIRVFDASDIFLTEGPTDASGELKVVLVGAATPGTEYIIRLYKAGVTIPAGTTQRILVLDPLGVDETNIFEFTTHTPTVPVSTDSDLCLLSGYFVDASLHPIKSLTLQFIPKEGYPPATISGMPFTSYPTVVRDRIIASEVMVQTDENGYVEVALPRGAVFDFIIHGAETPGPDPISEVLIPDAAGVAIHDVLFPYVKSVTYGLPDLTVAAGSAAEMSVAVLSSGLTDIEGQTELGKFLAFTTGDDGVATVEVTGEGKLLVTGIAAGATTLEADRVVGTYAPRRPAVSDLELDPDPFNITVT